VIGWITTSLSLMLISIRISKLSHICSRIETRFGRREEWKPFLRKDCVLSPSPTTPSIVYHSLTTGPYKFWRSVGLILLSGLAALLLSKESMAQAARWISRSILSTLHVQVMQIGRRASASDAPLIVSNHIAALDILALLSLGCCFVAKEGVKNLPGIGAAARAIGCIFVSRDSISSRSAAKQQIAELLKLKMSARTGKESPLVIFPEGTTTNGAGIIDFRRGAFQAGVPVQPVRLEYSNLQYSMALLDAFEHLCYLCTLPGCKLKIHFLDVVPPGPEREPDVQANQARETILTGTSLQIFGLQTHRDEVELLRVIKHKAYDHDVIYPLDARKSS
jgi:1-acyl-sn-glycerol-3-phosphate acyltransferase